MRRQLDPEQPLVERERRPQIRSRGRAHRFAQFESLAPDREHERGGGAPQTPRAYVGEHRRRAHRMAGEREIPRRSDRLEDKRCRGRHARIDKQRKITANEIGGVFGLN